ncbi:MAG: mechanosensitive ion channel family protein [Rubrivivax sp.]|nr:mechanosensitive ion channel family protein [Rubrivivax sp.]
MQVVSAGSGWWASGLRVVLIVVLAWVLVTVLQKAIRKARERIASRFDDPEAVKRAQTVGRVLRYVVAVVVTLVAGMLVLSELGVSVAPILGAAGVVGLAVGFGAQSLVKDYFTGLFILLEDQIHQGDVVKVGDHAGLVEEMTLRYVRLRDYDGHVHFVPNGQIATVVNMGRDHARAVVDVGIAYGADLERALVVMRETAEAMRQDPAHAASITDAFEVVGVERWADSAVILRGRFKVAPLAQWTVRRDFLRRLKLAFDREGIEIPFPQMTLHSPALVSALNGMGPGAARRDAAAPSAAAANAT